MIGDLVFVHIPKTAGTAFREALVAATPDAEHLFDYGPASISTSPAVRTARYSTERAPPRPHFRDHLPADRPLVMCGHFEAVSYARNFAVNSFITFLREPIARTLSEYKHMVRLNGYSGTLGDFCREEIQANKQSRFLRRVDWRSFLFVGLVEHYAEDLAVLSGLTGLSLENRRSNVAPPRQSVALDEGDRQLLAEINADDLALYDEVVALRRDGWRPRPFPGRVKAAASILPDGDVEGWAVADRGRHVVTLTVSVDGRDVGAIRCDAYRPDLRSRKVSLTGIGGFRFSPRALGIEHGPLSLAAEGWRCEIPL